MQYITIKNTTVHKRLILEEESSNTVLNKQPACYN